MVEMHSNFTAKGSKGGDGRLGHASRRAPDAGDHARLQRVVRGRLLPVHQHPARRKLEVGRHAHPPALGDSERYNCRWASASRRRSATSGPASTRTRGRGNCARSSIRDRQALHELQSDPGEIIPRAQQGHRLGILAQRQSRLRRRQDASRSGWSITARTGPGGVGIRCARPSRCSCPAVDIDFGKRWEFNFGVGIGVTQATDHLLIKTILGYRFGKMKD